MLEVFYEKQEPGTEVVGVEVPFEVPLIAQETGELLDRPLVGSLDLLERSPEGRLVVVDIKTASRKYTALQVEASLQLSIYSYATAMNGLADQEDLRLRFDVLTKSRSSTATGPAATAPPTSASSAWLRRSSTPSRPGFPTRWSAGTARTAPTGAAAGRGGEGKSDVGQENPE